MDSCQILELHGHLLEPKRSPAIEHMLKAFEDNPRPSAYAELLEMYGDRLEPVALHKSWFGPAKGGTHGPKAHNFSSSELACNKDDRLACRDHVLAKLKPVYISGKHDLKSGNGDHIMVAWAGIKHAMNDGLPTWQEAVAALHIEDLINHSSVEEIRPDKLGRKDPATTTVYDVPANFDGVAHAVKIFVRNHSDGNRYYDHVTVEKKTPAGLTGSTSTSKPASAPTLPYTGVNRTIPKPGDKATKSFAEQFDLLKSYLDAFVSKSYVAAHTRTTADGRVIQVQGFSNSRGRDVHTPDLFRQHLAAPKMKLTQEQARNPELFTPDIFSGETKASRPKRFQVRDAAGKVIKVFHGEHSELEARQHIQANHGKRLTLRNVTFDD